MEDVKKKFVSIYDYSGKPKQSKFNFSSIKLIADTYRCTQEQVIKSCNSFGNSVIDWTNQIEEGIRCIWFMEDFTPLQLPPLTQENEENFIFQSAKVFDGYSATFRQWKATESHCSFLHNYLVSFKVWFEGTLDQKNWVYDFGNFKRNGLKDCLNHWFDHTTVVAIDDPELNSFISLHNKKVIDLRIVSGVGCERYSELVFNIVNSVVEKETQGRVRVQQVEIFEHDKNSAIYKRV